MEMLWDARGVHGHPGSCVFIDKHCQLELKDYSTPVKPYAEYCLQIMLGCR